MKHNYPEIYTKLNFETAVVTFFKKDGTARVMLCTRNLSTASLLYGFMGGELGGHDNRCNINNGNIAVIDMIIGEARSFNIDRVIDIQWAGVILNKEEYDNVLRLFSDYKQKYESTKPEMIEIEDVDTSK